MLPVIVAALAVGQIDSMHDAQPGLHRAASARPQAPSLGATLGLRYGFTESVLEADGSDVHHQLGTRLAVSGGPWPWLRASLGFDARVDFHEGGPSGSDSGFIGTPRLAVRASDQVGERWALGGEVGISVPGGDAPSLDFAASSVELRALASHRLSPVVWAHVNLGYIVDNRAASVDDPARLSPEDQLALGVSDSDQLWLVGGVVGELGATEVYGEVEWRPLLGDRAPPVEQSPLQVAAGLRHAIGRWTLHGAVVGVLSARPEGLDPEALFPVPPRISVWAGVGYRFAFGPDPQAAELEPIDLVAPAPSPDPWLRVSVVDAVTAASIDGAVVEGFDDRGVRVFRAEASAGPVETRTATTTTRLLVQGFDHVPRDVEISLSPGDAQWLRVELEPELPRGELRGQVTDARGAVEGARVRVEPIALELATDVEGRFAVELEPGVYRVHIEAPRRRSQVRAVTIEDDGVTVLNVELYRYRR